jgi:puromycin-sensitive aminopeptidase
MKKGLPKSVRLPSHIEPTRYQISLKPDLEAFVFTGEETIFLTLGRDVKTITLHSKDLEITSAEVIQKRRVKTTYATRVRRIEETVFALKITYDDASETATFWFPKIIPKGNVKLVLSFRGILNDRMHGFYRSRYKINGKEYHLATTQFEATDARRAFPCFDEPAVKAIFEVKLIVPTKSTALSNTIPTTIREHEAGYKVVEFAPTPRMSTYLVAFIVGDLEHIEKKTKEGVLVRVFTTPGKKHQAVFALDCAVQTLSFFTKYFDIPYPLPVLDMIAIPDFASGAMENWGAITYREAALLVDPKDSSAGSRQWVATVIAHELSHQWFGNLVTMEWWTHLWLNEGFASYIEYLAVDHIFPDWDIWTEFVGSDLGRALTLDSLKHTHPIEVAVHHPDEISEIFDAVSYAKGASVIRMLAEYLGERDFREGLRYYLKKHSYKNTSTIHLWEAFEKVSQKPVAKMMSVWTGKAGYPVLTVSEKNGGFDIEQTRFFSSPLSQTSTKDKTVWSVPVSFTTGTEKGINKIMVDKKHAYISNVKQERWIKMNTGETGVFRTNYSPELRMRLAEAVIQKELSVVDRLGLIRDMFDLAYAGHVSAVDALLFAGAYRHETNYAVWSELAAGIARVGALLDGESWAPLFENYACEIFRPMVKKVGWKKKKGETHTDALLRSLILAHAGRYGDREVVAHAQKMFSRVTKNKNSIPADLRSVVYNIVARHGGPSEYHTLAQMHHTATLHEEKNRIAGALGRFTDKKLLKQTLALAFSPDVRSQDAATFIASVLVNHNGRTLGWQFIKKMWPFILKRYGSQKDLSYFVSPLGAHVATRVADDIERFFKKNPVPGAERTVLQTLERIRAKALWLSRDKKKIAVWIKTR